MEKDINLVSFFYIWIFSFPSTVTEEDVIFLMYLGIFVRDQLVPVMWLYFWIFYQIPLICFCVILCIVVAMAS